MITFAHENPALHINLSVVNAVKPDGRDALTYEFVVAEEQDFFNQVAFAGNVAEGDQKTVWTPVDGYFYSAWSEPQFFVADTTVLVGVALIDFRGADDEGVVLLWWETSSETGVGGFDLYRSREKDRDYAKITGAMIDAGKKHYSFTDAGVEAGTTYFYKLVSVSHSGMYREFDPVEVAAKAPRTFKLYQNYPNPFNPATTIRCDLPKPARVRIAIYNVLGQEVATALSEMRKAGYRRIMWDGRDSYGRRVSSGMYIYRITAGDYVMSKKMVLIR